MSLGFISSIIFSPPIPFAVSQPGFKNLESSEKEAWEIMETAKEIKTTSEIRKNNFLLKAVFLVNGNIFI